MSKLDKDFYLPVLKFKQGELFSLLHLHEPSKDRVYPLFEIMPVPWDYAEDKAAKTLEEHLASVVPNLKKFWGERPFMLDFRFISEEQCGTMPPHPFTVLAQRAKDEGLHMVPVVSLGSPTCAYQGADAVKKTLGHGVALRIVGEDFDNPEFDRDIDMLLDIMLGVKAEDVDVVVDLGQIPGEGLTPLVVGMRNLLRMVPPYPWRSLSMVASSFPENLSDIPSSGGAYVSRGEWKLWKALTEKPLRRVPNYGDYTVVHPLPFEFDPRMMQMGAKVKYTTEDSWLVIKGRGIRSKGYAQYRDLARQIMELVDYCGPEFSWGDDFIKKCAEDGEGTGNQTTWVRVGVNHHMEFVLNQLSKRTAP